LQELADRNKDLESRLATESQKISGLDMSFSALREAQKQLEGRCQKLMREKTNLEIERSHLIKENENLLLSVTELNSRVEQSTSRVEQSNVLEVTCCTL